MSTEFGRRLKAARHHARPMSQKQLAKIVGISQGTLSELETIAHGSSFTSQLAAACGVNAAWLATGEGSMLDKLDANEPAAPAYRSVRSAAGINDMVQMLSELLTSHGTARRRTVADVLARFAVEPNDAELADELARQLEPTAQDRSRKRSAA